MMATQAGVWIDHKQAVVVSLSKAGPQTKKILFDIGQKIRPTGGPRLKHPYKPTEFVAEDTLQRKLENDRNNYYDDVIAAVRGVGALLIFGPGEAKGELHKRLQRKKQLRGAAVELASADNMTDRQIAAKVGKHFTAAPKKAPVIPRKSAKKKKAKTPTSKRKKKSAK